MAQSQFSNIRRTHPHGLTPPQLAKLIGVSGRTVERRCAAGYLPFMDHGPKKRLIQWPTVDLVVAHGLGGVERMVRAGRL
jgi:hypothetical protein